MDLDCQKQGLDGQIVGYDPKPAELAHCPQNVVIQRAVEKIVTVGLNDRQVHLWREPTDNTPSWRDDQSMSSFDTFEFQSSSSEGGHYFVSSLANGTTTGILREHAIRMDSRTNCTFVEESIPDSCPGDRPFVTKYESDTVNINICVEGAYDRFPWTTSRSKQEVEERFWVQAEFLKPDVLVNETEPRNRTMRCDARSRRGWFEVGNYQNDNRYEPLVETWPSQDELAADFNDYDGDGFESWYPATE